MNLSVHKKVLIPSLVYMGLIMLVIFIFPSTFHLITGLELNWSRWDSGLYLQIAKEGIQFFPCGPSVGYPQDCGLYCGNCGWAPAYSGLMYLLKPIFGNLASAGVFISALFLWLSIYKITYFKAAQQDKYFYLYGLLLMVSFGSIYYYAIFPLSMALFFILSALMAYLHKNWLALGIYSACLIWVYSIGFVFAACMLFMLVVTFIRTPRLAIYPVLQTSGPIILSALAFFTFYHVHTGHWNALFLTQQKYGHVLQTPWLVMQQRWHMFTANWGKVDMAIEIQNYISILFFFFTVGLFLVKRDLTTLLILLVCMAGYGIPYSLGTQVSVYRSVATIAPLIIFIPPGSFKTLLSILIVYLALFIPMAWLFFASILY